MDRNLAGRLFIFAADVIKYLRSVADNYETKLLKYQLIKSATSYGANYEKAQAASSKADFKNKINISLREIRNQIIGLEYLEN